MSASQPGTGRARDHMDQLRGEQYRFLSRILAAPPEAAMLDRIAGLQGDDSPLGQAYAALARTAAAADLKAVEREYFELFIGVGRGELLPYASFYLTGFLNERPLADLRGDLLRLGIARARDRHEPEDHIALILEVMAGMAVGEIEISPEDEAAFFRRHLAPWAAQFFDDLAIAPSADFYRPVAEIGRLLVDIEARAFALAA
ncbi:molecular chaperone TorD family protein [Pararhodobacter sp. SW119]|uniref:TorD/DmsD family molecular chaperone n=1 Tax=Pararhodobacter sp. SW119 TaxID=2780075 RepID=UPI001AE0E932|nr:molecular chaperone TorD family protein [Pararhodobacter sp. SW119]